MEALIDVDADSMLRLKNGEDLALNEIMLRWQQPLINFIYRSIGNEQEAIDIAQQTFVRLYESRHRYQPSAKLSTYLFSIALNLCRNHRRWLSRHPTISIQDKNNDNEENGKDREISDQRSIPSHNAINDEISDKVKEAVLSLPNDLKEAILLFEYEDLSYDEIGKIVKCSPKAVETRLYRARKILKEKLFKYL